MALVHQKTWPVDGRRELIQQADSAKTTSIVPGVELRQLVGAQQGAQNLFTGLLSLAPAAAYRLYVRPFTETFVVMDGEIAVEVEDRRYRLGPLAAITIVAGRPRRVVNVSSARAALVHVSLASSTPDQTWVNGRFTPEDQPPDATGRKGAERVCSTDQAKRFELAPRAVFQDLFNADLGPPGICGGYGVFEGGARLPCHRHEFDESITIVKGTATCIVEGRRYELKDNATALVPTGLCHYFINLTLEPMAMIWVYAGDRPDRIVMDESFCQLDKSAAGRSG